MQFSSLKVGQKAQIVAVEGKDKSYRYRLHTMGLTKGSTFQVIKIAPLGCPILIEVRGTQLSLRKQEAEALQVKVL